MNKVLRTMGDRFRFVFRNVPLTSKHPHAQLAAEAAEAAGVQGNFCEADSLELPIPLSFAREMSLDFDRFRKGVESRSMMPRVQEDIVAAVRSGVQGTPTCFINGIRQEQGLFDAAILEGVLKQAEGRAMSAGPSDRFADHPPGAAF